MHPFLPNSHFLSVWRILFVLWLVGFASTIFADETLDQKLYDSQKIDTRLLSPSESASAFDCPQGYHVDLFCAEPDVQQPIAMDWDAKGRLWIAENYTYAESAIKFDLDLSDRIIILEDQDNDGRADQRTVFWNQGKRLTSIAVDDGGVWALCPPQLLFILDADRDDIPDAEPQILLDGFEANAIHHNFANGLRWGPDGWLYGRHGIQAVSYVGTPGAAEHERTKVNCCIWRFHPVTHDFEVVCHGTTNPWGMDWDEHGHLFFINTVIGHLWHALPNAHLQRMYGAAPNSNIHELMPQIADHVHWADGEDWLDVKKHGISDGTDLAGGGHAHSGMLIYRGENWQDSIGKVLTLNFHGRRINVENLARHGAGFVGTHEPDRFETSDVWFRGVELSEAPDGSVFVIDWSDIGECHENDGVHRHSGRVFRLRHENPAPIEPFDLWLESDTQLVQRILKGSTWMRRMARRVLSSRYRNVTLPAPERQLLVSALNQELQPHTRDTLRGDASQFKHDADESQEFDSITRLECLWTLYSTNAIAKPELVQLLDDGSEHVRLWAWQLLTNPPQSSSAKTNLAQNNRAQLDSGLVTVLVDAAGRESSDLVKLYIAGCASRLDAASFWPVAFNLAEQSHLAGDRDFPLLFWYALEPNVGANPSLGIEMLKRTSIPTLQPKIVRRLVADGSSRQELLPQLLDVGMTNKQLLPSIVRGIGLGLSGLVKLEAPSNWVAFTTVCEKANLDKDLRSQIVDLGRLFGDGRAVDELLDVARNSEADTESRKSALRSLAKVTDVRLLDLCWELIRDRDLGPLAVPLLLQNGSQEAAAELVSRYPGLRTEVKTATIDVLSGRSDFLEPFFQGIASRQIPPDDVKTSVIRKLQLQGDEKMNSQLQKVFPSNRLASSDKLELILQYEHELQDDVKTQGGSGGGKALFTKHCASCHVLFGEGKRIGPELTGAQRSNLRYLLDNIVNPSGEVAETYRTVLLLLDGGISYNGVVLQESDEQLRLQTATEVVSIDKREILERKATNQSLMPEGILKPFSRDERRDLLRYLMYGQQ